MRRPLTLSLIALIALAVLAVLGASLALAFTQQWDRNEPTPTAPVSPPAATTASDDPASEAISDRQQIALEAARIMTTWSPAKDLNRTAAELRARPLMTEDRAGAVVAPERPAKGAEWLEAAKRGATSAPTVELNQATELTDAGVSVTATWTWDSPDGSEIPTERGTRPRIYYFEFTQEDEIHDYSY